GDRLVVFEPGVPVTAVAERLVARMPAPAERVVLEAGTFEPVDALEHDPAAHPIRAVTRHPNLRRVVKAVLDQPVDLIRQRAGRAPPNRLDALRARRPRRLDPRLG